jgi:hypothetical protein
VPSTKGTVRVSARALETVRPRKKRNTTHRGNIFFFISHLVVGQCAAATVGFEKPGQRASPSDELRFG